MTSPFDRDQIEQYSTQECDLQDTDTEFIDEATALVERRALERLVDAWQGINSLAHRRPRITEEEVEDGANETDNTDSRK
jgi:hypothetical protein